MSKPKMLVLSQVFPNKEFPQNGTFVIERIKRVASEFDITIISPQPWIPNIWPINIFLKKWEKLKNIPKEDYYFGMKVYYPKYFALPKHLSLFSEGFLYFRKINRLIKKIKPDLIKAFFVLPDGHAAYLAKRKFNIPYSVYVLGSDVNVYPKKIFCKKIIEKTLENCDLILACSNKLVETTAALMSNKNDIKFVPNGYDPSVFSENNLIKPIINLPKKFILFVGNLVYIKSIDIVAQSTQYFKNDLPIVFAGKGDPKWALNAIDDKYKEKLIFIGPKPPPEIAYLMHKSELLILPSRNEGFPLVLIENMAMGKPAVATNVGGIPELINESNGILVEKDNPIKLAQAIDQALNKVWDSDKIISQIKKYDWDITVKQEILLYQKLINYNTTKNINNY